MPLPVYQREVCSIDSSGPALELARRNLALDAELPADRARWFEADVFTLLREWERARRADWQRMRLATDGIQRLFTHNANAAQLLRHWGMRAFDALPPLKSLAIRAARGQALAGAHALTHDAASRPGA